MAARDLEADKEEHFAAAVTFVAQFVYRHTIIYLTLAWQLDCSDFKSLLIRRANILCPKIPHYSITDQLLLHIRRQEVREREVPGLP